MSDILIRTLAADDIARDAVWQLREAVLRKPLGLSLLDEDLSGERDETTLIAVDAHGTLLGCLMLRRLSDEELKLRQMAVMPGFQGKGIGRMLLEAAQRFARENGFRKISLHARSHVLPFYEKAGYQAAGNLFFEVGIPHVFMSKGI